MKNITRRGFLQLAAAAALVCAAAPLTGCGKNVKKLVLGDWYMDWSESPIYSIYDDGTCKLRGDYGLGRWSLVNKDRLNISGFYGETETYVIEKISKKSMTVHVVYNDGSVSEETATFYHTYEDAKKGA